jgi:hypothetical protein
MAFSLHAHYCAEHVGPLAARVREMRQPPYGLDTSPDPALAIFFDELLSAPDAPAPVLGLYEFAIPALAGGLERSLNQTCCIAIWTRSASRMNIGRSPANTAGATGWRTWRTHCCSSSSRLRGLSCGARSAGAGCPSARRRLRSDGCVRWPWRHTSWCRPNGSGHAA